MKNTNNHNNFLVSYKLIDIFFFKEELLVHYFKNGCVMNIKVQMTIYY